MRPREAGQSGRIPNSYITTSWTRAGTSQPGNSLSSSAPRCVRPSHSFVSRSESNRLVRKRVSVLQTGVHIMNRPEQTFATEQIRLERRLPSYWRVTFDMPPVNIFGPKHLPLFNDV